MVAPSLSKGQIFIDRDPEDLASSNPGELQACVDNIIVHFRENSLLYIGVYLVFFLAVFDPKACKKLRIEKLSVSDSPDLPLYNVDVLLSKYIYLSQHYLS